jgi:anti-sigma B factor antagonist
VGGETVSAATNAGGGGEIGIALIESAQIMLQQTLDEELTIYTAAEYKPKLLAMLAQDDELELSLSKIQEIDSAGLQLLILMKREAARLNKVLSFVGHSSAVIDVLELTNLTASFGDQVVLANDES